MSRPRRAFTLVEVLVSLAIFAVAAVVLSAAYLNVLGAYGSARQRHQEEEDWKTLRALLVTEADREKLERGGRFALPGSRFVNWAVRIEPTEVADLFAVTIRAESAGPGSAETPPPQERKIMLLRPAWSEPGERDQLRAATKQRWQEQGERR
jgi:general secretion pathway protein I